MKVKNVFISTFFIVFLAELGDKTQIASYSMAARNGQLLSVALGSSLALISTSLIAVLFGYKLAELLPRQLMKYLSGLLFIAAGVFVLVSRFAV